MLYRKQEKQEKQMKLNKDNKQVTFENTGKMCTMCQKLKQVP